MARTISKSKISPRQRIFAEQYVLLGDGVEAAKRAGWEEDQARRVAKEMLASPAVLELIFELRESDGLLPGECLERLKENNILRRLANIAYGSVTDFVEWSNDEVRIKDSKDLSRAMAESILSIEMETGRYGPKVKVKLHDKMRALELLGKYRGLFKERPMVETNLTINWGAESKTGGEVLEVEAVEPVDERYDGPGVDMGEAEKRERLIERVCSYEKDED